MYTKTGELYRLLKEEDARNKKLSPVPESLIKEAEKELQGEDKVIVDMTKDTPLVNWAKKKQRVKDKKRSNLKAMQKASKRRNR